MILKFLISPAGDVVIEDAPHPPTNVETRENRNDDHSGLHRHWKVRPDHVSQPRCFAFQRKGHTLHFLVVFQLELKQLHHLGSNASNTGNRNAGELIGGKHLLHGTVSNDISGRCPPITGHHNAVGIAQRNNRGAVGQRAGL